MARLFRTAVILVMAIAACSPTASGPVLPRPAQTSPVTRVLAPTTTTTQMVASESIESAGPDCPSAFCLIYHIRPEAAWSDGTPVRTDDFSNTVTLMQGQGEESIYSLVQSVDELEDGSVRVALEEPAAAWQSMFSRVFRSGVSATTIEDVDTTGPFRLVEWEEGDHLTIARDPEWWGSRDPLSGAPLGDVDDITFVFINDLADMVDALDDGEVDVITARPDEDMIEGLNGADGISKMVVPGPFWEHVDFNHDDPLLSRPWVRRAISLAIDRTKILDRTVHLIDPSAAPLDNTIFMEGTEHYERHFQDAFDPEGAEQILVDHGCRRGEDGIFTCDQARMSFVWASTNDDPVRAEILASVTEDLGAVGIEVISQLRSPSEFVTREVLFGGPEVWQLINFSWRARPEPLAQTSTYFCAAAGQLNVNHYCSDEVERLMRSSQVVTDPTARAALLNAADRLYLEDRALIPLYQKPIVMAWNDELSGPVPNYTTSSDLWNVASWTGKESIVVALPQEPADLNPLSFVDDNANLIMSSLIYGAFGMTPTQSPVPVLIESVDLVRGRG